MPDEKDGRYKKIVFTSRAEEAETVIRDEIMKTECQLLKGITEEEQREFIRIASKMLKNLE